MNLLAEGWLAGLAARAADPVQHALVVDEVRVDLAGHLGATLWFEFDGRARCLECQRALRYPSDDGHCWPCSRRLAHCDHCWVSPDRCHHHLGTCREPRWGERNCMRSHALYLAVSSQLKVGITRAAGLPQRWLDQGATAACVIGIGGSRRIVGTAERLLAQDIRDRTDWRVLLRPVAAAVDLEAARDRHRPHIEAAVAAVQAQFGIGALSAVHHAPIERFRYPDLRAPDPRTRVAVQKPVPRSALTDRFIDAEAGQARPVPTAVAVRAQGARRALPVGVVGGRLEAIRGPWLVFDRGAFNLRRHAGHALRVLVGPDRLPESMPGSMPGSVAARERGSTRQHGLLDESP